MRAHLAIFGNVRIYRGNCPKCNDVVLFPGGLSACCGIKLVEPHNRLEVVVPPHRRSPSKQAQERLLEVFRNACAYCQLGFGEIVVRKERRIILRLVWDHFAPYSISGDSSDANFLPACQLCNGLKRDRWFQNVEEARSWIVRRLARNGVRLLREALSEEPAVAKVLLDDVPAAIPREDQTV